MKYTKLQKTLSKILKNIIDNQTSCHNLKIKVQSLINNKRKTAQSTNQKYFNEKKIENDGNLFSWSFYLFLLKQENLDFWENVHFCKVKKGQFNH